MERIAVFTGSFDPFTVAHLAIAQKAAGIFERVIVAVGKNVSKRALLPVHVRVRLAAKAVEFLPNVQVDAFDGLAVEYMKAVGAKYFVRGIHSAAEFDVERDLAWNNQRLFPEAETVFFPLEPEFAGVSSSAVREILHFDGSCPHLVPASIYADLLQELENLSCSD